MNKKRHNKKSANANEIIMTLAVSIGLLFVFLIFWWAVFLNSEYKTISLNSANWMLARQEQNGHFGYEYDPWKDTESREDNIIRQAGAGYIMSEMFDTYNDGKYLESTAKNLDYLADRSKYETRDDKEIAYIIELGVSKTGAMALADISCIRIKDTAVENEKLKRFCSGIANSLDFLAEEDGGYSAKYLPKTNKGDSRYRIQSPYYNGEAFLADAIDLENNKTQEKQENIQKHFNYFNDYYAKKIDADKQGADNSKEIIGFYLWGMRALNRLDTQEMQDKYADMAYLYTNHVIEEKKLDSSFYQEKNNINNCYALEGVISAYAIADRHGDSDIAQKYKKVANDNLKRLAGLQANKNMQNSTIVNRGIKKYTFPNPEQAIGGFFNSMTPEKQQMRIDNTQHCLGAYLLADKYM